MSEVEQGQSFGYVALVENGDKPIVEESAEGITNIDFPEKNIPGIGPAWINLLRMTVDSPYARVPSNDQLELFLSETELRQITELEARTSGYYQMTVYAYNPNRRISDSLFVYLSRNQIEDLAILNLTNRTPSIEDAEYAPRGWNYPNDASKIFHGLYIVYDPDNRALLESLSFRFEPDYKKGS